MDRIRRSESPLLRLWVRLGMKRSDIPHFARHHQYVRIRIYRGKRASHIFHEVSNRAVPFQFQMAWSYLREGDCREPDPPLSLLSVSDEFAYVSESMVWIPGEIANEDARVPEQVIKFDHCSFDHSDTNGSNAPRHLLKSTSSRAGLMELTLMRRGSPERPS